MDRWMIAFLVDLYAVQGAIYAWYRTTRYAWSGYFLALFGLLALAAAVLAVGNIVRAVAAAGHLTGEPLRRCSRGVLAMKMAAIPFFVIHLGLWTVVGATFLVIPGFQILLLTLFIGVGFAYLAMLPSSVWAIVCIVAGRREGRLSAAPLHIVLQLLFVLDVVDFLCICGPLSRGDRR